jgi:hypothetical protein
MSNITHSFVSGKSDGEDAAVVRPSNWNDAHTVGYSIQTITGTDTIVATKDVVICGGGTYTVTLPSAAGTGSPIYVLLNGAGVVTLARAGSDTIGGMTSVQLNGLGDSCVLIDAASLTWGIRGSTFATPDNSWARKTWPTIQAQVPALVNFEATRIFLGFGYSNANTGDIAILGGMIRITNGAWGQLTYQLFPAALNSVPWAVALQGIMLAPVSAKDGEFGVYNGTSAVSIMSQYSIDTTHLVLSINGVTTVSSWVIDGNEHTFALTFDLTTVKLLVDGAVVASSAAVSGMTQTGNYMAWYASGSYTMRARRIGWAW